MQNFVLHQGDRSKKSLISLKMKNEISYELCDLFHKRSDYELSIKIFFVFVSNKHEDAKYSLYKF